MSQMFTVYVRTKKREKWFYVNAVLSGTIKNVLITMQMNLTNDISVNTVKYSMSSKEKRSKRSKVDVQMLTSTKSNFH